MNSNKGTSLVEIMIVIAIIAVFMGSVSSVVANFLFASATGQNFLTAAREHQRAMDVMIDELTQTSNNSLSTKFTILDGGNRIRFKKFLSFTVSALGYGTSTYSTDIEFYRDSATNYVIRLQDGQTRIIGLHCTQLTFTELTNRRIMVTMTNTVGDSAKSYVGIYTNTVEISPQNPD